MAVLPGARSDRLPQKPRIIAGVIRYNDDGRVFCEVCGETILVGEVLTEGREAESYRPAIERTVAAIKAHMPVHSRAELEAYSAVMIAEAKIAGEKP